MPSSRRPPKTVDVVLGDGRCLRARRLDGARSPLVLLHGLLDSSEGWDEITQASPRASVAFDLPGFGGSDLPRRALISSYAEDVAEAMRRLDLRDVTLVGHSLGGAVAAALSELAPDRIAALVLLAPAGFGRIPLAEAVSVPGVRDLAEVLLPRVLGFHPLVRASYRIFVTAGHSLPDEIAERMRRNARTLADGAVMATQAVVAAGRSRDGFHRRRLAYRGPVSVLWGEKDLVVPAAHGQAVLRALPQAALQTWSGMGHHPQRERLAELAGYLEAACAPPPARAPRSRPAARARAVRSTRAAALAAA